MEYFGLWISSDFGRGHSMARPKCTTYGSPTLSCKENFEIEQIEVWGAGKPPVPEVSLQLVFKSGYLVMEEKEKEYISCVDYRHFIE